MRLRLLLLCWSFAVVVGAQSTRLLDEPTGERLFGSGSQETFNDLAPTADGRLALVGHASRSPNGTKDDVLFVLARTGNLVAERTVHLGRSGYDAAYAVEARPDGGFLVAGTSEKIEEDGPVRERYSSGRDGWLLWLDAAGNTEAELLLGGSHDDELRFLNLLPDGSWLAAGSRGERGWLVRFRRDPQPEVLWEQEYLAPGGISGRIFSGAVNDRETIALTGVAGTEANARPWLLLVAPDGTLRANEQYLDSERGEGRAVASLDDGRWVVVGEADGERGRGDGLVLLIDADGKLIKEKHLGGREQDRLTDVRVTPDGDLLLVGNTFSHQRGARQPKLWGLRLKDDLDEREAFFFGSKLEESAAAIGLLPDGNWVAVGSSDRQLLKGRQAAVWYVGKTKDEKEITAAEIIAPRSVATGVMLTRGGPAWARPGLELRIRQLSAPGREYAFRPPPYIVGTPRDLSLPLPSPEAGDYELQLFDRNKQLLGNPARLTVTPAPSAAAPRVTLEVLRHERRRGNIDEYHLRIRNDGTAAIDGLRLLMPAGDCYETEDELRLTTLPVGAEMDYVLPVRRKTGITEACALPVRLVTATDVPLASSMIDLAQPPPDNAPGRNTLVVTWLSPNPDLLEGPEIVSERQEITIQLKIISDGKLDPHDFDLRLNGQSTRQGRKLDEVRFNGDDFNKTVTQTIHLQKGVNTVYARMLEVCTDTLRIIYEPERPNLHLISIGVPAYDLEYTQADARDFAALFQYAEERGSEAFGYVFIDTLLRPEQTTKTAILKTLRRLEYREAKRQIKPNDVLVVFVSSHGVSDADGSFHIAASDYDQPFLRETSIDFGTELTDYLARINCRKLFFVDACHSGNALDGRAARDLTSYMDRHRDLSTMLSCRAEEYSYEDAAWGNGAFTEAFTQVVADFYAGPGGVDANEDGKLTLAELYAAVEPLTAALARQKRPRPRTQQRPLLNLDPQRASTVLFTK